MDKMLRAAAMVAVLLICLSILHCSSQLDHELLCYSLNSVWVVALWILTIISIFFLQLCQLYGRLLWEWLTTFQFSQGKETSGPWFGETICWLTPGTSQQFDRIFLFSLPGSPKVIRICSYLRSCLELGHHHFQSFGKSTIKMVSL